MAAGKLVLVVDDEEAIRKLETDILQAFGYRVEQAGGGAAAIDKLKASRPDLVLLDLRMAGVSGWDVLEFIGQSDLPPRVIVVSGQHEVVPPGNLGRWVAGYVFKPFNIQQLLKTCESVLAAPAVMSPGDGQRKEARRTFVVETTLLTEDGQPLAIGQLLEVSRNGLRLELALNIQPGDTLRVKFRIPGREEPLVLTGRVRWRNAFVLGAEAEGLSPQDVAMLRQMVGEEGPAS